MQRLADRAGRYQYDAAGRLSQRKTDCGHKGQHQENYHYDANGQLIRAQCYAVSAEPQSRQTSEESGHNTAMVEFTRDPLGRITQETQSLTNAAGQTLWRHRIAHRFDQLGNEEQTALQYLPPLNWQTYGSGHLHGITLEEETLIDFERDKLHRETRRSHAGAQVLRKYDRLSRLLGVRGISQQAHIRQASLTAMPAEFDDQFVEALKGYREVRQSLTEQAQATQEVLQAAKAVSAKKAGEAVAKAAKSSAATAKAAVAPKASGPETPDEGEEEDAGQPTATPANGGNAFDLFG